MNPFRDRTPEKVAERYLQALKEGRYGEIGPLVDESYREGFLRDEAEHPILSYRLGDRSGDSDLIELMYEVERGNGYGPARVAFTMLKIKGEWAAMAYTTVY